MADTTGTAETAVGHEELAHAVPNGLLVGTWLALLVLTWLTVAASWVDLGELNIWLALGIASVKATLVALFFMHLRWSKPFYAIVFITAIVGVALLIAFTITDTSEYRPTLIPEYAPLLQNP